MNILGEGFPQEIIDQISQRQKVYGVGYVKGARSSKNLIYLNGNTSWCKLVSSVNIDDQTIIQDKSLSKVAGINSSNLAKKFVLFNGVNDINSNSQRAGINYNSNDILGGNSAYGIGGTDFGIRPMMGIQSANIKHENRGSIRRASVKIKAFNKIQFDIIDVLYLRLGFNILLEWGHSMYYDNNGELQAGSGVINSLASEFLEGAGNVGGVNKVLTYENFLTLIAERRISSNGNYDAMFAKVTNFQWSFLPDGSYDITLDLVSIGDVVESFKVNALVDGLTFNTAVSGALDPDATDEEVIESYSNKNSIGQHFYKLINNPPPNTKDVVNIKYENKEPFYYIRLGALLEFFQNNLMYLAQVQSELNPILKFDYDVETNLMYVDVLQVSVDPTICLVNRTLPIDGNNYTFSSGEPFESTQLGPKYGRIMNIYVNMRWILLKMDELKDANTNKVVLIDLLNNILSAINGSLGGTTKLEASIDDSRNTVVVIDGNPLPNVQSVIDTLNKSGLVKINDKYARFDLYGYNNNAGTGSAGFIKDFSLTTEISPELSTMLTVGATANSVVVGENSTAFSRFNAGLTDRFKEKIVQSSNSFSTPPTVNPGETESEAAIRNLSLQFAQTYNAYKEYLKQLAINPPGGQTYNDDAETYKDALTSYTNCYQQLQQAIINNILTKKGLSLNSLPSFLPGTGFIPFNMSLTMDGLSGMKIYNKFYIDTDFLPANYPNTAEFLIKNVTHKIENNKWFTTLESIVISKGETDPQALLKQANIGGGVASQSSSNYSTSYYGTPIPASDKTGATPYDNSNVAKSLKSKGKINGQLDINDSSILEKLTFLPASANKTYYPDGYFRLYPSAATAFKAFYNAAISAGYKLTVTSAYRSRSHQSGLGSGVTVASPGSSPHGWGGAIDFSELYQAVGGSGDPSINSYARQTNALYKWMAQNGPKFGWHNPYRLADGNSVDEVWHWEYWGP